MLRTQTIAPTQSITLTEETRDGERISLRITPEGAAKPESKPEPKRQVKWNDDVVDNEGMGKKSSKSETQGARLFLLTCRMLYLQETTALR
jgi:hypothetical protein